MISVLIPVYNYTIVNLVKEIHGQLIACKLPFEIIALEDGSTTENIIKNQTINTLSYTKHIVSKTNMGRVATRQMLCDNAKFNWLLFMDADVMPKSKNYINAYIEALPNTYDVIYGGFAYKAHEPKSDYMLRWTYGKTKEEIPAEIRNKKPYKIVISANFMTRKAVFNAINSQINHNHYGLDNIFGALLKTKAIKVHHIDNEVYHLGIEKSLSYIQKKEKAADTLLILNKEKRISSHQNDLLSLFIRLKRFKLNYASAIFYRFFKNPLRRHLTGTNPSIKMLQLYRICYMCYTDLNSKP